MEDRQEQWDNHSECVAQSELDLSRLIYGRKRSSKGFIRGVGVVSCKHMPVKSVDEFGFQGKVLPFRQADTLDDGKVFIDIPRAANLARNARKVSENVSTLRNQA